MVKSGATGPYTSVISSMHAFNLRKQEVASCSRPANLPRTAAKELVAKQLLSSPHDEGTRVEVQLRCRAEKLPQSTQAESPQPGTQRQQKTCFHGPAWPGWTTYVLRHVFHRQWHTTLSPTASCCLGPGGIINGTASGSSCPPSLLKHLVSGAQSCSLRATCWPRQMGTWVEMPAEGAPVPPGGHHLQAGRQSY